MNKILSWWYKLRAKILSFVWSIFTSVVIEPIYLPSPTPPMSKLATVILKYNNEKAFFVLSDTYSVPLKGVIIHKITPTEAVEIADTITTFTHIYNLPVAYVCACIGVESVMDPGCQNGNLGPGESNAGQKNNLLGYDMGICQFKLKELIGQEGLTSVVSASAFAFDIKRAMPYFCKSMVERIQWAKDVIARNTSSAPDPRLNNPYVLATGEYNYGPTGIMTIYSEGSFPNHCVSVIADEKYFADALGVASIFSELE